MNLQKLTLMLPAVVGSIFTLKENMNELLKKYNEYMRLKNFRIEYELDNGSKIEFIFKEENFVHLLGLHKLTDIQIIQFWLDKRNKAVKLKTILDKIKHSLLTDEMIKKSVHYYKIHKRYENFSYDAFTTLSYTDVVIRFNPTLLKSKIKSDYIFFEADGNSGYKHMGIAPDDSGECRYVETFFYEDTDKYIRGQEIAKIRRFTMYDDNNSIIVTDSFPASPCVPHHQMLY